MSNHRTPRRSERLQNRSIIRDRTPFFERLENIALDNIDSDPEEIVEFNEYSPESPPANHVGNCNFNELEYIPEINREIDNVEPINIEQENLEVNQANVVIVNMADIDTINNRIKNFIPEFSGYGSADLKNDLNKFLQATRWTIENTEGNEEAMFLHLLKFRLTGDAFERINRRTINTVENLLEILTNIYSQTQSIDDLFSRCFSSTQKPKETAKQFGTRLQESLDEYKIAYSEKYEEIPNCIHATALENMATKTFKQGILDPTIRKQILIEQTDSLANAIERADTIEDMLSCEKKNTSPLNSSLLSIEQLNIICSFCNTKGHTWDICAIRKNTPLCSLCNDYGHLAKTCESNNSLSKPFETSPPQQNTILKSNSPEVISKQEFRYPPKVTFNDYPSRNFNPQNNKPQINCAYCKIRGHTWDECHKRKNTPVCNSCGKYGHTQENCFTFNKWRSNNINSNIGNDYRNNPNRNNDWNRNNPSNYQNRNNTNYQNRNNPQQGRIPYNPQNRPPNQNNGNMYNRPTCNFCRMTGHTEENCYRAKNIRNPRNTNEIENAMQKMKIHRTDHYPDCSVPSNNCVEDGARGYEYEDHGNYQRSENSKGPNVLIEDNTDRFRY